MWIMLSKGFVSIVKKDCADDELMVRARRAEHIEANFPGAKAVRSPGHDYLFRARVKREEIARVLTEAVMGYQVSNFKDSIDDEDYHHACMGVWHVMGRLQQGGPYSR